MMLKYIVGLRGCAMRNWWLIPKCVTFVLGKAQAVGDHGRTVMATTTVCNDTVLQFVAVFFGSKHERVGFLRCGR